MKPVLKYVGYAAKGLGVLLVQSSKDILAAEHINPLAVVIIRSGKINETDFLQAFSEMFSWGRQWRATEYGPDNT